MCDVLCVECKTQQFARLTSLDAYMLHDERNAIMPEKGDFRFFVILFLDTLLHVAAYAKPPDDLFKT